MEPIIRITHLQKSYGSKEVLKDINFEVYPGQIIGYIGPNGAGKSTTVKILLGIITEYNGHVELFGKDLRAWDHSYKKFIGYVPEVSDLYEVLSGMEYLTFLSTLYEIEEVTARHRITQMANVFELSEALSARISSYSKGMRQKLMLIASLIHDPEVLFLDEPLSGLDANTALVVKELMHGLARKGKTVFYSSHVMEVVEKISDRILILNDGEIVADGDFATLKASSAANNLENLFNALTGFDNHAQLANDLIATMSEEAAQ